MLLSEWTICTLALSVIYDEFAFRSIAEETVGELEKEKTMKELEMRDAISQHRAELEAREAALAGWRDRDHENRATIDLQRKVHFHFFYANDGIRLARF